MEGGKKEREREEEEICGGKDNGDVMCSSSRRTMWLQCTDFQLHKAGWGCHSFHAHCLMLFSHRLTSQQNLVTLVRRLEES